MPVPWSEAPLAPLLVPPNPIHRPYLGGDRVRRFRGRPSEGDDHWTEEWLGSVIHTGNRAPDGRGQGLSRARDEAGREAYLKDLVEAYPTEMLGEGFVEHHGATLGFVVKLISLAGPGPVHAHPDRAFASRFLGEAHGQAEAWVLLGAEGVDGEPVPAGIGFRDKDPKAGLLMAIEQRSSEAMRGLLHDVEVAAGEAWLIRPSTPHFLGAGAFFIEVVEPSDHSIVPEFWSLGIEEADGSLGRGWETALDAFDVRPSEREDVIKTARQRSSVERTQGASRELGLIEPHAGAPFDIRLLDVQDELEVEPGRFSISIVTSGSGHLVSDLGSREVRAGDVFAVPAPTRHRFRAGATTLGVHRCLGPMP